MHIEIKHAEFDPWFELSKYQKKMSNQNQIGACATFVGSMRDFNEEQTVSSMTLEYYPGMTEKQLEQILHVQIDQHKLEHALIIHRVGKIHPGESIVLVAIWSSHRKQAFDACRIIMEDLKHNAPFWKKELTDQGEHWIENNTAG